MTVSFFQGLVQDIKAKMADPSILFRIGMQGVNEETQRRKIVFVRKSGNPTIKNMPARPNGDISLYQRTEDIDIYIFAQRSTQLTPNYSDEDAAGELDLLFDIFCHAFNRSVNGANGVLGPYIFMNDDSNMGTHSIRQPGIKISAQVKFPSRTPQATFAIATAYTYTGVLQPASSPTGLLGP